MAKSIPFKLILGLALLVAAAAGGSYLVMRTWFQPAKPPVNIPVNANPNNTNSGGGAARQPGLQPAANTSLSIHLSEGQALPENQTGLGQASQPAVSGQPLSAEEIKAILDRLQPLDSSGSDQVDFKLPADPIPPPLTGSTTQQPFPPQEAPTVPTATVSSGPLQVLRHAPDGEVAVAPFINVTFNQPMVPLGTLADLGALDVPVKVEPALPGTWRWLGTKTLTFSYDSKLIDRLPKATEYHVSVPAGTKSANGGELAQAVEWTFTTPPPSLVTTYPNQVPTPLNPLIFIGFDQRIDPAAMLKKIQVQAGGRTVALVLASQAEVDADPQVKNMAHYTPEGRWLAFKPAEPLPPATGIDVSVLPGAPSAEGPLTMRQAQSFNFSTYAPLRVDNQNCTGGDNLCRPLEPFYINFNNPINADVYTDTMLSVSPEIPGVSVNIYGSSLAIGGATKGQTDYTITVGKDLQDIFGQKLGHAEKLTFHVGKADPVLVGPDLPFVTVDPAAVGKKPVFSVYAMNYPKLDVQVYAVQPTDWPAFKNYLANWTRTDVQLKMPGRLVFNQTIGVEAAADDLTQVDIDLSPYLDGKFGQFIVVVKPPKGLFQNEQDLYYRTIQAWVQITQIGLDAFSDFDQMTVWTTALKDGVPLANITVRAGETGQQATTGADGTAHLPIPSGATYLVATQGADQALLPRSLYPYDSSSWGVRPVSDELRWYIFDDRQMYRPGEEVHIKGWIRRIGGKQTGDVGLVGSGLTDVQYQVLSSQGNEIASGQAPVNELGGFDFALTLPEAVNLGSAQMTLTALGSVGDVVGQIAYHAFQIQEFRRPEFEVTARNESSAPYFAGGSATLAVDAKYYAGGALPGADVSWQVTYAPGSYSPPNWPDFTFGEWTPWWESRGITEFYNYGYPPSSGKTETLSGQTDANGTHYLKLDFDNGGGPKPTSVIASATVMDVNRQAWSSTTSLLVHPADLYIGLRSERYFVQRGAPIQVDFIVTDLDGKPAADRPVEITAARMEWKYVKGEWVEQAVDVQTCRMGSALTPQTCTFQTPTGGSYTITAQVKDEQGRLNQSSFTRWVSGGELPPARKVEQEKVTLIPDKQTYQPGDTAQVLVQSPFSPAEGLLTVSRSGTLYTQRFQVVDGAATLSIPIEEQYIPNLEIQVDLVGAAPRTGDQGEPLPNVEPRPAYASGSLHLSIPPLLRTLTLQAVPEVSDLAPGGSTTLNLTLVDAAGAPVPDAELAVVVVDEAILALSNYTQADPISVFYSDRPSYFESVYSRANLVLLNPQALVDRQTASRAAATGDMLKAAESAAGAANLALPAAMPAATQTAGVADHASEASAPIAVRANFNPLATFAPSVRTDGSGQATLSIQLPDNLTRYRIMVVAVDSQGKRFGQAEASLTARLPLMVRPSAPRFLNFGDKFELPVVLQNQTSTDLQVSVAVRAANLDLAADPAAGGVGLSVTVPGNQRVEVRFPAATDRAGVTRLQFAAVSGGYADAATLELPVYTPATTEAFATYGVLDEGAAAQPLLAPNGVFPQYGGLEVDTSSTALQALTDAVLYLQSYPFECTEQLSSRILSVAALRDVLTAFKAEGLPSPAEMEAAVTRDLARLQSLQNNDGGFPYWRRGFDSIPFNTIHVAHALARASQKGFDVPGPMKDQALAYLRDIESHYPADYSQTTRWTLSAYALYVRGLLGDADPDKALRLLNEAGLEKLSLDAIGWLWPVLQGSPAAAAQLEALRVYVNNHAVETAGAANFTTSYDDQSYLLLASDRRTDAILLDALIGDNPNSDLIPKLVNGLLAHRTRGRWGNTQENVFVLLALDRYFNAFEAQTPDFVARLWLGNTYAGSVQFQGRSTERQEISIPMPYLLDATLSGGGTQNLVLSKEGAGRLYYRLGLRYAPTNLTLPALDMGFVVQRRYEAIDNPADVSQDASGTWHIRAGTRVRVHITMEADNRRYHVALVDPLPAGLEIVNPDLAVSSIPPTPNQDPSQRYSWWWWTWYEHQNLRDERAEAFTPLLWEGVYQYTYIARATTPGLFVVPPSKAEEMYSPEVFGRSASDMVSVEAP